MEIAGRKFGILSSKKRPAIAAFIKNSKNTRVCIKRKNLGFLAINSRIFFIKNAFK